MTLTPLHQATRVRFRGGDPLALTKRIEARRPAHPYKYQAAPAEKVTPLRIAGMVLLLLVMFVGIAWTGPIFAAAMGLGR